jgi:hypothetical protein
VSFLYLTQAEVLGKLPEAGKKGNTLPPLPSSDVFDGTKKFEDKLSPEFFTQPGKVKVPLLPPAGGKTQEEQPIIIEDNGGASPV